MIDTVPARTWELTTGEVVDLSPEWWYEPYDSDTLDKTELETMIHNVPSLANKPYLEQRSWNATDQYPFHRIAVKVVIEGKEVWRIWKFMDYNLDSGKIQISWT